MHLRTIVPEEYARLVLPFSAELWAGKRSLETYVAQTVEIAQSAYGKRYYRTLGLYDGGSLVTSCKRFERNVHLGGQRLRVIGVGAVFTPVQLRGRGYASAMLAILLDGARAEGFDAVYLFSDIRPQFYQDLGFRPQPSRVMHLRSDALAGDRITIARLEDRDWEGVRRSFAAVERMRTWGFSRTPLVWDWIRMRIRQGSERAGGAQANFVVRERRGVCAYVLGARLPERDSYVLDEFGFTDGHAQLIPVLLRGAAGDLRRITGWLPPDGARRAVPRGTLRERRTATFMIAPLSELGRRWCALSERPSPADGVWSTDHI